MKKLGFILFILIFPCWVFASDFQWNVKAGAYNRVMGESSNILISFKPYASFLDFYAALDLEFNFEPSGAIKQSDWNSARAWIEKIGFLGYGEKDEMPAYFRFGAINDFSIGYGILVNRFNNDVYYPARKKAGFIGGYDLGYTGLELFVEDIIDLDFFGGRLFMRPLYGIENKDIPEFLLRKFVFGLSFITDTDPLDQDNVAGNYVLSKDDPDSTPVRAYAADISLTFLETENYSVNNYIQYGDVQKIGAGFGYGFTGKVFGFLEYKGEFNYSWGGFTPFYFNSFYDVREIRSMKFSDSALAPNGWGYMIGFYVNPFKNLFKAGVEFSDNAGEKPLLNLYLYLKPGLVKRLYIKFNYQRRDITGIVTALDMESTGSNVLMLVEIGYEITQNASVGFRYIKNYRELDGVNREEGLTEIQTNLMF